MSTRVNEKNIPKYYAISILMVFFASYINLSAYGPTILSPLSPLYLIIYTTNVIPGLPFLIFPTIFVLWSGKIDKYISLRSKILSIFMILLSFIWLVNRTKLGIEYQGQTYVLTMYLAHFIVSIVLGLIFFSNQRKASPQSSLLFNTILFIWLAWGAFPWLGELI